MALTVDDLSFILHLNDITQKTYRYAPIFLLMFGIIGNLLSCLVFSQRVLRTNPCAIYFLAVSISNLVFLPTQLSTILGSWDQSLNLTNNISGLCKLMMFIILTTRTLILWFLVLATIDRYLISSSNINRRRMSSLKQSHRCIVITCVAAILIWAESTFCFDANRIEMPVQCYTTSDQCHLYNSIALSLIAIAIPSILMFIFGLLTIINIRQSRRNIGPNTMTVTVTVMPGKIRRNEHNLTQMLLTQVFLIIILNFPYAMFILYLTITDFQQKTVVQEVVNGFIFNTLILLPFIFSSISFLFYTLVGKVFR